MSRKHTIIKGTFILTLTGFATRFMGFFYRIFLSHTFGEEGVGLYQLIFPVYALCFSLTSAGIELALSRCVAARTTQGKHREAKELLYTSLILSVALSVFVTLFLQKYAVFISEHFLQEPRCSELLIILSYTFPLASIHSCICGYYFGLKKTGVPAISQFLEQSARILGVFLLYLYGVRHGIRFGISIAVAGLVAGECISSLFALRALLGRRHGRFLSQIPLRKYLIHTRELLSLSIPLTASRVLLNLLQSIEAVSIPVQLQSHGMTLSQSLGAYGILTGMALPCILFPSAITNSVSTMLLPTVAEIQTLKRSRELSELIHKVTYSCIFLGSICCVSLLSFGKWIGAVLFHSPMAGNYIITLAWMCPFLYTNNTLISTINGIGKTTLSFFINSVSLGIRIASVFFLIPLLGIKGYLWGLLASQVFVFLFCLAYLEYYLRYTRQNQ
ncbi:MAG: polysaccharide biosynthesis protein [Dorea sp.]|jgi:stage V sporulation protein B|nr:polysaccharide biosynthesis protein [Dorea sp.]